MSKNGRKCFLARSFSAFIFLILRFSIFSLTPIKKTQVCFPFWSERFCTESLSELACILGMFTYHSFVHSPEMAYGVLMSGCMFNLCSSFLWVYSRRVISLRVYVSDLAQPLIQGADGLPMVQMVCFRFTHHLMPRSEFRHRISCLKNVNLCIKTLAS